MSEIQWLQDDLFEISGTNFRVTSIFDSRDDMEDDCFYIAKGRDDFDLYCEELKNTPLSKILEIGIFKGGSVAFMDAAFSPEKLVAIEFDNNRQAALDDYIEKFGRSEAVFCEYGLDQSDSQRIPALLEVHFPNRDIDLVVDDASHYYEETRASFNMIFPYLKKGGMYIIEDWSWAHSEVPIFEDERFDWSKKPSLANLVFEIIMIFGSGRSAGLISDLKVNKNMLFITRGDKDIAPGEFDISDAYYSRHRSFSPTV